MGRRRGGAERGLLTRRARSGGRAATRSPCTPALPRQARLRAPAMLQHTSKAGCIRARLGTDSRLLAPEGTAQLVRAEGVRVGTVRGRVGERGWAEDGRARTRQRILRLRTERVNGAAVAKRPRPLAGLRRGAGARFRRRKACEATADLTGDRRTPPPVLDTSRPSPRTNWTHLPPAVLVGDRRPESSPAS